jgi:hypothetical protein
MPMASSTIVVDTNAGENALYEALVRRFDESTVTRRKLDVGDVVLSAESGTVVVERKTWLDWAKSMTDGRYNSQKARLRSLMASSPADDEEEEDGGEAAPGIGGGGGGGVANAVVVLYLIEGTLTGWGGKVLGGRGGGGGQPATMGQLARMTNAQLEAAVVMTSVRDGVPVLRSKDGVLLQLIPATPATPATPAAPNLCPRQAHTRSSCWPTSSRSCAPASCCRRRMAAGRRRRPRRPLLATRGSS